MIDTVLVIAKEPIAGRVKTRLVPALSYEQAAAIAAAALADTLATAALVPARQHVLVLDGADGAWVPSGWRVTPQRAGGLDVRLVAAFTTAGHGPALLVGMDTPQVQVAHLSEFDPLRFDACLGMAPDGGFWAIGFREPARAAQAITGVPMSTSTTGAEQLRRLIACGLRVQLISELQDVDTFDDAVQVAALVPGSMFACAVEAACRVAAAAVAI